jgi:hypothetical protein
MKFTATRPRGAGRSPKNSPFYELARGGVRHPGILGGFAHCQRTIVSVADDSGLCSGQKELLARWARRNTSERPASPITLELWYSDTLSPSIVRSLYRVLRTVMITQETGVSIFKGAENRAAGVTLLTAAANLADETRKTSKEALPRFLIGGVTPHGPQANCLVVATSLQASAGAASGPEA